ncbi:6-methylsalicylic acid synthase [Westerdykella ornata]|uniref:6-methylsalicylic acid synthase n=1 Tax=Westerdykella ornata TaxID=318751 RepID=A0A6A6JPA6_WESOR|nr:6-methylsalicylic acid synthase [Westerdykella ornata]KAF2276779.1 6-methylsalicylic acid synthase [Westerdykella ornata]
MGCRLPGGISSPEDLWTALMDKKVASGDIPEARWEPYYRRDTRNSRVLNQTTKKGYFLDNIADFDAAFFGVSPKEAVLMDPQQRLTLEVTWEALEDAGISPQSLAGSNTAVFTGVNSDDYSKLLLEDLPGVEAWMGIGTAYCGVPNRISYLLDLRGPSTAVDAACASSLVAVHHGRQSLLTRESDLAIVGGVNAICGPGLTRVLDEAGAISKDGVCRSFDDAANGYGRGEGAGIVILKRLSDAIRDNDRIVAVLKGSAVGQDGRTNGIMAPNGLAQENVARTALGCIDPLSIQYVEAHATSTSVGDPVEIGAMAKVYGSKRDPQQPCFVGSVKANVGHLEAGAGVIGLIKAAMALERAVIPPQANVRTLNKKIDWKRAGIDVALAPTKWPQTQGKRRAAICSYGYGGTVSHAVIEQAPCAPAMTGRGEKGNVPRLLALSAPQEKRLVDVADSLADWISNAGTNWSLEAIQVALCTRRAEHDFRATILASSHEQAKDELQKFAKGESSTNCIVARTLSKQDRKEVVWLFSGHGAQWSGMGKDLLAQDAAFRQTVESLDDVVDEEVGFSPLKALEQGDFTTSDKVQVLTYVMQVALAASLQSRGLRPGAIIGHSVGEIAAAVAAGALSALEGALVVCRRARLYKQVMGKGAMILVNLPFAQVATELRGRSDAVAAIDSSPNSCVVSGTLEAVDALEAAFQARHVKTYRVKSDIAFHSPLLETLAAPLMDALDHVLHPRTPHTPLYSTACEDPREVTSRDPAYWVRNMTNPVLLTNAVNAAAEDGFKLFLEVSSHPIISHSVNETLMNLDVDDALVVPSLLRGKEADATILRAAANLWCKGAALDFQTAFSGLPWATNLPKTKWRHQSYWKDISTGSTSIDECHDRDAHTLLGRQIPIAGSEAAIFATKLDDETRPFPGRHPLHGTEIVPAAVLFNTFLHATKSLSLSNVQLRVPVAISAPRDVQVVVEGQDVRIMSQLIQAEQTNASWLTHTTGRVSNALDIPQTIDIVGITKRIGQELSKTFTIDYLAAVGVPDMGFPWTVLSHYGTTKEMIALVDVCPEKKDNESFPWQPSSWAPVFDAATSIGSTIFFNEPRLRMPAHVANLTVVRDAAPPKMAYIYVKDSSEGNIGSASDVTVTDEHGSVLAKFTSMRFSEIEASRKGKDDMQGLVFDLAWPPARLCEVPYALEHIVFVGDESRIAGYQSEVNQRGIKATRITSPAEFSNIDADSPIALVYVPETVVDDSPGAISETAEKNCEILLDLVKATVARQNQSRIFVLTHGALNTDIANAALVGLSRIIAAEQPSVWGSLIDVEDSHFPFQAVKYVSGADIVKVEDSVARVARLRPLPARKAVPEHSQLEVRPEGTYIITGGLGDLGLEVAEMLVAKGARRLVLVSRRKMPARKTWTSLESKWRKTIDKVLALECKGATVYTVAVDMAATDAAEELSLRLESLNLPPVLGVVHAAGVIDDQFVLETDPATFNRVLAPKVRGALALHSLFPPQSLSFFVLFSSCGQLFGFPGQASYAAANAFLDSLALLRRAQGDNALALQYTSWRGMGLAATTEASAEFIEAELEGKGITSVSRDEALSGWEYAAGFNVANAVVLRCRELDHDEPLPADIIEEVVVRKPTPVAAASDASSGSDNPSPSASAASIPPPGPERIKYLIGAITGCVATVLQLDPSDVDSKAALPDLGMDSVMTVALRKQLQKVLGVKVPPTLVWGHPTVSHLAKWFEDKI